MAKAVPESQTSVKIGNDAGLKPVDDSILPEYPKGEWPNASLEILEKALPESQASVEIGNDAGFEPIDDPILPECPKRGMTK